MNGHIRSEIRRFAQNAWQPRHFTITSLFLALVAAPNTSRASTFFWTTGTSESVVPKFYAVVASQGQGVVQSGPYRVNILVNQGHWEYVDVQVNADGSASATVSGGGLQFPFHFQNASYEMTTDGRLYNSSMTKVVGSVEMEAVNYTFTFDPTGTLIKRAETPKFMLKITPPLACSDPNGASAGINIEQHSLSVDIGLGMCTNYQDKARLNLFTEVPPGNMATPQLLQVLPQASLTTYISDANGARQVLSAQILADIVTNNPYQYAINLYQAANAGTTNGSGLYQPIGSPFKVVTFKNPDGTNSYNRLWVTVIEGAVSNQWQYNYGGNTNGSSNTWVLLYPSGLRKDVLTTTSSADLTAISTVRSIYTPGTPDVLVYQEQNDYACYIAYPNEFGPVRIRQIIDPNGARLTNTWTYCTNAALGGSYQLVQQMVQWNGYWEQYQYDSTGRETNRISSFGNCAVGSASSSCRVKSSTYSSAAPNITTIDQVLGQEVGRTYTSWYFDSNCVKTVHCQVPGATWTNSSNLLELRMRNSWLQPTNIYNIDGTISVYVYVTNTDGSIITTVTSGQPNSAKTAVVEGTQTITVTGPYGQMVSNIVLNVTGGVVGTILDQDSYSYAASDYNLSSPTVTHLDGTTTAGSTGSCCGTPNLGNAVAKDGTTNYYTFDAFLRRTSDAVNNVTTSTTYDPRDNIVSITRAGSVSPSVTTYAASYDTAGRLLSVYSPMNGSTTLGISLDGLGQTVKSSTYSDGSTRVETYYQDGSLQSVTGTAVFPVRYIYGIDNDGNGQSNFYTQEIKLDASGTNTVEWTKTYRDMLGREYKMIYSSASGSPFSSSYFNTNGQLTNQIDPDGVSTIYAYNLKGEQTHVITDVNQNRQIDFSGTDRITFTTNDVVADNGTNVRRTRTYVWSTNSVNISNLISTAETSVDGLQSWSTLWNNGVATTSQTKNYFDPSHGYHIVTNIAPDGSYSIATSIFSRIISMTHYDSQGQQISSVTYGYDDYGRQNTVTDVRNGTTTNYFSDADQVSGTASPSPGSAQSSQVTTNYFDSMGRVSKVTYADNTSVTNEYYPTSLLKRTYGSRAYPVGYGYDAQGRITTMTNWSNFGSGMGARVTTWQYDGYRGFLTNKLYDGNAAGPGYSYTSAGRMSSRTWARGITTSYGYNSAGDLQSVQYSDTTSGMTNGYDRRGRETTITNGASVCTLSYNDASELLGEVYSGGPLDGLSVTNAYDGYLRRTALALSTQPSTLTQFGYDNASRLLTVTNGSSVATYSYLANSSLIGNINFQQSGTTRMTTTKAYDNLNRLTSISSTNSQQVFNSFAYAYNAANQRTSVTNADGSYWVYGYDALGQVTSGVRYWSDGTSVAGQQYDYTFDNIGNRTQTMAGGDQTGANLRVANYWANNWNQHTQRDIPAFVDIMGASILSNTVTINGQAAYRKQEYFRQQLPTDNSASALWTNIIVSGGQSVTGDVYVAQEPEQFTYDADGNLTRDGRWTYLWDAENRLLDMTSLSNAPSGSKLKLDFAYDYRGRRIQKTVSIWNGSSYLPLSPIRFMHDGWNLIAILDSNTSVLSSFTWGLDLSGTFQEAGGVGGLLAESFYGTQTTNCIVTFDANGNISGLANAADGGLVAEYEYGPLGEIIRSTGNMAKANPFTFSTKYLDDESDILYYGLRYYHPSTGRWLSKDPIQEKGGLNLYAFIKNDSINAVDVLGTTLIVSPFPFPGGQSLNSMGPYIMNVDDGFPDHVRMLKILSENDLLNREREIVNKLRKKCRLQMLNPWDEADFDTTLFQYFHNREYYLYRGKVYADNEINYFGIGMYEAWAGDQESTAFILTVIWKDWQYNLSPGFGTYYWLDRGYTDYISLPQILGEDR